MARILVIDNEPAVQELSRVFEKPFVAAELVKAVRDLLI